MASADLDWPAGLPPFGVSFYLQTSTRIAENPYSRDRQTLILAPPRWIAKLSFRGGAEDGNAWQFGGALLDALLADLAGPQRSISLWDFRRPRGRGDTTSFAAYAATVAPTAFTDGTRFGDATEFDVGAGPGSGLPAAPALAVGATSAPLTGFAPNRLVRARGDYIGFGATGIQITTADAWSDAGGNVTVDFKPALLTAVGAGPPRLAQVRSIFRLTGDDAGSNPTDMNGQAQVQLDFVEDLTP